MIEAFLGILIASFASVALLTSISVSNKAFKNSGRQPLTNFEKKLIKNAGYSSNELEIIELDIRNFDLK